MSILKACAFTLAALMSCGGQGVGASENSTQATGSQQAYDIAAYVWPAYQFKDERWNVFQPDGVGEWAIIRDAQPRFSGHRQPRVPLWGYEDESEPAVMEKKIEAATSHGVNVFIYDWYWYEDKPFLEKALNDGFLKAKNVDKMKFYLMWANHEANGGPWSYQRVHSKWPGTVDRATFDKLVDRWIVYMKKPSYYKIEGKPVFSIYELQTFINGLGGIQESRDALVYFDTKVKEAGFPGLHVQGILWGQFPKGLSLVPGDKTPTQDGTVKALKLSSLTNYQFVHLAGISATRACPNSADFTIAPVFPPSHPLAR